jgi:hypothetical protein
VNGHHPYCLFTRVIAAGLFSGATFDIQFAIHGAFVGFHGVAAIRQSHCVGDPLGVRRFGEWWWLR